MVFSDITSYDEFYWFASECMYLTQDTEISAYLETVYHEYKKGKIEIRELKTSPTYVRYNNIYKVIDDLLKASSRKYLIEFENEIQYLLEKIKPLYKNIKINTFIDLLQYWRKQIMLFLKKAHYIYLKVKEEKIVCES